jgi:hypothetical protein
MKFEKGTFPKAMFKRGEGKEMITATGYVSENFGIEKQAFWQVTHKQTGYLCSGVFSRLKDAKVYVERLEALEYNWNIDNPMKMACDRDLMDTLKKIHSEITSVSE